MTSMTLLQKLAAARATTAAPQTAAQVHGLIDPAFLAQLTKPLVIQRIEQYITIDQRSIDMLRHARLMAFSNEPVLIQGETGTGKEIIAKIMLGDKPDHKATRKFYPINCAGIVDTLFESLIFGHVAGSFTGSTGNRPGLLVSAGDGVAFFDEVGELPLTQQAKLLRILQERKVTPVGSTIEVDIRCRFVFATNRNLEKMVETGTFREDLYYRVSALELHTIPLRDRPDDAYPIVDKICELRGWDIPDKCIPQSVINSPGNVRALERWLIRYHILGI